MNDESGFSLIEVLIAALILAVGVLGAAAMQGVALTYDVDATELTRATTAAGEIIERMRFNKRNVAQYAINTSNPTPCPQNALTQAMAKGDCDQWVALLNNPQASGLNNALGIVAVTPPAGVLKTLLNENAVTVTVQWQGAAGQNKVGRVKQVVLTTTISPE